MAHSVRGGGPRVAVAVDHPVMRSLVTEVLSRELGCVVIEDDGVDTVVDLTRTDVELVVVDGAAFSAAVAEPLPDRPPAVIVLGPEPDPMYRDHALSRGAAAWVAREEVGRELVVHSRRLLGLQDLSTADPGQDGDRDVGILPDVPSGTDR